MAGAGGGVFEAVVFLDDRENLTHLASVAQVAQERFAVVARGHFESSNQGEGLFASFEVVARGFAQVRAVAGVVEQRRRQSGTPCRR